jgi:hypothetical protein
MVSPNGHWAHQTMASVSVSWFSGRRFMFKLEAQEIRNTVHSAFVFYGLLMFAYAVNVLLSSKTVIINVYDCHTLVTS